MAPPLRDARGDDVIEELKCGQSMVEEEELRVCEVSDSVVKRAPVFFDAAQERDDDATASGTTGDATRLNARSAVG